MDMGGGVNTTMKDKHLNLEDAACQHNGQSPGSNKAAQLMVLEPPPHPSAGSEAE